MVQNIRSMWSSMSGGKRGAFIVACLLLLSLFAGALYWAFKDDKEVLFSDLETRDQAAIVSELEKQKIPYTISDDGSSIMVDREAVHRTRLKVMSEGVDIKGTVGFEIFNETDYGASEFAQKVNYQRALQGELSRTILSMEGVKSVRVHLAMPEANYLRRKTAAPTKASVAVTMEEGLSLSQEQVLGIQRLVAASVQDLDAGAVVVTNQKGVTLSRAGGVGHESSMGSSKLELKKEAEQYLTKKVAELLDRALGPGQAIVSVDVTLNYDQVNQSREELIPMITDDVESTGVVTRKRQSSSRGAADASSEASSADRPRGSAAESAEVEYAYGKRVEQVVGSPGGIKRLSVGIFLLPQVDPSRAEKIRDIVSMAVGLNPQRGDGIAVQTVGSSAEIQTVTPAAADVAQAQQRGAETAANQPNPDSIMNGAFVSAALLVAVLAAIAWVVFSRRRLSDLERQRLLREMQTWLRQDSAAPKAGNSV